MAWLVALDEGLAGRRFDLDAPCLVGRGPYNHVVLNDSRISRQHAKISPEAGGHVVYDLNSANGTFVNDVQVKRQRLTPSDIVRFGPFSFRFDSGSELGRPTPQAAARRHSEELTRRGFEPPSKIMSSVEASSSTGLLPSVTAGLTELEDAARRLRTLYAFMQSVSTGLDATELTDRILKNVLDLFPAGALSGAYLFEPGSTNRPGEGASAELVPHFLRRDGGPVQALTLPAQFQEEVVGKGRAVLSAPMAVTGSDEIPLARGSAMHAPLIHGSRSLGVLHVRAKESAHLFTQADLDLFSALAAQAALALENARLHQESLKQQRLAQDLVLAEQIQKSFLPSQLPAVPGLEFITEYRPAYSVGGDFYDVFWLSRDRLAMFIGDVSGKGVAAALLMARVSSDLRAAGLVEPEPARVLSAINRAVCERNQPDIFVTVVYLTMDVRSHRVVVANAGHLPPLIRRGDGAIQRIEGGAGTAVGILEHPDYEQVELLLEPGDTMVLCTDGVVEATNADGAQFGFDRLEASLGRGTSRAGEIAQQLHEDLRDHVGDAPQYDDLTLIVCGVGIADEATVSSDAGPTSTPQSWRASPLSDRTIRPPPLRD